MKLEYDSEVDGLFIWFVKDIEKEKANYEYEIRPSEFNDEVGFLFSMDKKLMGIEVQPASKYFEMDFLSS